MLSPKKDEGDEKIPEPGLGENPSTHSVMTTQCGFWRVLGFIFFFSLTLVQRIGKKIEGVEILKRKWGGFKAENLSYLRPFKTI